MNDAANEGSVSEDLTGVPTHFHPVVEAYGKAKFELVLRAGLSAHAARLLVNAAKGHPGLIAAVQTLVEGQNTLAQVLIQAMGWTEEELGKCQQAVQLAQAARPVEVKSRLILPPGVH